MNKFYTTLLLAGSMAIVTPDFAQCTGGRFHNFVFPGNTLTSNIVYGSNLDKSGATVSLKLDVYEPQGDVSTSRPLVILAHGGSFISGSKTGSDVVPLAQDLAKLGYVVASIDYRLGMTHFPVGGPPDSTDAGAAVMRAVHDGRAAVRYFKQNIATGGNTYKIDSNNIYFAGVSAGGFISLHLAYMDQLSEFPSYVDTVAQYGLHGGIEGLSGNPGYNSNVRGIINICGALGDTAWMHTGDDPVLSFHGTNDNTVPYGSAVISLLGTYPLLQVDGSSSVAARANHQGIENCFTTWYGQDHVPEVSNAAYYDSMLVITRNWLEHYVCGVALDCNYTSSVVGVDELSFMNEHILVYPNPANTTATIDLSVFNGEAVNIEVFDAIGRKLARTENIRDANYQIARDGLPGGLYFVRISSGEHNFTKRLVFN